jgi:hypothetical protein
LIVIVSALAVESDIRQYRRIEKKSIPTIDEIIFSCSPASVHQVGVIKVSKALKWTLTHSHHCLGNNNIATTISISGNNKVDRLISRAIVLRYIQFLKDKQDTQCDEDVVMINSKNIKSSLGPALIVAYKLQCHNLK